MPRHAPTCCQPWCRRTLPDSDRSAAAQVESDAAVRSRNSLLEEYRASVGVHRVANRQSRLLAVQYHIDGRVPVAHYAEHVLLVADVDALARLQPEIGACGKARFIERLLFERGQLFAE